MDKTKSTTEEEEWVEETITGLGPHYKTTITDGTDTVVGRGKTAEEAEEVASEKWKDRDK